MSNLLEEIEYIIAKTGYECVNVSLKNDNGNLKIQALIDLPGGINVDDCEIVSKAVNKFLDSNDANYNELNKGRYYLEVSSPGIERPLFKISDYEKFTGHEVRIKLNEPVEGRKNFTGVIQNISDSKIYLELTDGENACLEFANIKSANLVFRFNQSNTKNNNGRR